MHANMCETLFGLWVRLLEASNQIPQSVLFGWCHKKRGSVFHQDLSGLFQGVKPHISRPCSRFRLIKLRSLRRGCGLLFVFFWSTLVVWHSAHRDNRAKKTWEWRGRSTQLIVTGMSRLTYCLKILAENPPMLQQHCQVDLWPLVVENIVVGNSMSRLTNDFPLLVRHSLVTLTCYNSMTHIHIQTESGFP